MAVMVVQLSKETPMYKHEYKHEPWARGVR